MWNHTIHINKPKMLVKAVVFFSLLGFVVSQKYHGKDKQKSPKKENWKENDKGDNSTDTLILTSVVFRHGDRTPDSTAIPPNDPYINDTYFPYGLGQLTLQGKQRAYHLGELLHERYKNFLGPIYSPFYVESFTSNYPRTQMSLQAVHAGLFPPTKENEIKEGLEWQPAPYIYYGAKDDYLISTYRSCDLLYWITDDIEKSGEYDHVLEQFKPLYEYLTTHAGWYVNNTRYSFFTYNTLKTEEEWGHTLPEWTNAVYPEPLKSAASWFWKLISSTPQLRRISIGNLIKKIILDSEAKANGELMPQERKMFLYSGHDFTVVPILSALGHYDGDQLPYTTHVIFELHKINNVYGFKVFVQDYKEDEPRLLKVHDCDEFCPIDQFKAMFEDHFPGPEWCSL